MCATVTRSGVTAALLLAMIAATTARAQVTPPAAAPAEGSLGDESRLGVFVEGGAAPDGRAFTITTGGGVYPWRFAGFELRVFGSFARLERFSTGGMTVPGVDQPNKGERSVQGMGGEIAAAARFWAFEPWGSAGFWVGQAKATVVGCSSAPFVCTESTWEATRSIYGPVLGAGLRVRFGDREEGLTLGVEARRVFARSVWFEPIAVAVRPRPIYASITLGWAYGGFER